MIILKVLGTIYFYLGMPLLFGMAWNRWMRKEESGLSETYVAGSLVWFFLFFALNYPTYLGLVNYSYWKMVRIFRLLMAVFSLALLLYLNKRIPVAVTKRVDAIKQSIGNHRFIQTYGVHLLSILFIGLSILFFMPSFSDDVIEVGYKMISQDSTMGEGLGYVFPNLYYVIPAGMFHISLATEVHLISPIGLLPFFLSVYRSISIRMYREALKQKAFFIMVVLFYGVMSTANVNIMVTPFQNIWNPLTLFYTAVLPLNVYFGMSVTAGCRSGMVSRKVLAGHVLLFLLTMFLSMVLTPYGAVVGGVLFLLGVILA